MKSHNLTKKSSKRKRAFGKGPSRREGGREGRQEALGGEVVVARVKRSVHARKKRRKVLDQAKGLLRPQEHALPLREGAGRALAGLRVPTGATASGTSARSGSSASTRGRARERALLQPVHERRPQGGDRARPQVARRPRRRRPGSVHGGRGERPRRRSRRATGQRRPPDRGRLGSSRSRTTRLETAPVAGGAERPAPSRRSSHSLGSDHGRASLPDRRSRVAAHLDDDGRRVDWAPMRRRGR